MRQSVDLTAEIKARAIFAVGDWNIVEAMVEARPLKIFDDIAMEFLAALSRRLLTAAEAKAYTDVIAFAFWCRRASLDKMAAGYGGGNLRLGRGVVFHVAPSNIAVNFAYSWAASLLAGNAAVVRLPSKDFPQVAIICRAVNEALAEITALKPYVAMARYGHEREINDYFSALCQTRVIWGGDETIGELRKSPLLPRSNEITFADRYSLAAIGAAEYIRLDEAGRKRLAQDFFNDTYLSDQNACTSPRLVAWLGEKETARKAREGFWAELHNFLNGRYDIQAVQAVDKLDAAYRLAAETSGGARIAPSSDNLITRVEVWDIGAELPRYFANSGFFLEYIAGDLVELMPLLGERCQTLSYFGIGRETLLSLAENCRPYGIDRVVPIGRTLDFSLVWDGYDLICTMSREIVLL